MKKFCISLMIIVIILLSVACGQDSKTKESTEYLRIHIRANSNSEEDQNVKYAVKEAVVNYLTPIVADCKTKSEATEKISLRSDDIRYIADEILKANGFEYSSLVKVCSEEFPTRVYEDLTLEKGYYDALIIGLGKAEGDNWWCVVYPPLCFTSGGNVKYRSKILEIIAEFKQRMQSEDI